jgi:hypothetical protein
MCLLLIEFKLSIDMAGSKEGGPRQTPWLDTDA